MSRFVGRSEIRAWAATRWARGRRGSARRVSICWQAVVQLVAGGVPLAGAEELLGPADPGVGQFVAQALPVGHGGHRFGPVGRFRQGVDGGGVGWSARLARCAGSGCGGGEQGVQQGLPAGVGGDLLEVVHEVVQYRAGAVAQVVGDRVRACGWCATRVGGVRVERVVEDACHGPGERPPG